MYYYHQMSGDALGFKFKKAFSRITKITKTSFQPKKIMGALASVTATVATGGLGPLIAPKIFSANSATMRSLGMAMTAIAVVAGAVVLGPAIAGALGPMLTSAAAMAGKAVTGMTTFMKAFNMLSPQKQQQMSTELTPEQIADVELGKAQLTEQGIDYSSNQAPGSLRVQGEMVPAGYGNDASSLPRQSASGIDPLYLLAGGGALLLVMFAMNQRRG